MEGNVQVVEILIDSSIPGFAVNLHQTFVNYLKLFPLSVSIFLFLKKK